MSQYSRKTRRAEMRMAARFNWKSGSLSKFVILVRSCRSWSESGPANRVRQQLVTAGHIYSDKTDTRSS